ncbi:SdpI family protein [Clostridium paraputrificum]|uniref:SdpI family protein n=1 Tax=Clostridium paraputrificum TaxID=29363 RepID=UPI003D34FCCA
MLNRNKERGILLIILANMFFSVFYYMTYKSIMIDNLYYLPVISFIILIQYLVFRINRNRIKNKEILDKYYYKFLLISTVTLMIIQFVLLYNFFNTKIDSYKIISLVISYMIIYIGNIMPQFKQNSIIGIRTKKTLSNEKVWKEANVVGGITLVITGGILFILSLLLSGKSLIIILLISIIIWSFINDIYISIYCKKNKI